MKTYAKCLPCFVRQAAEGAALVTDDEALQEAILRAAFKTLSEMDMTPCPPVMGQTIHRLIRDLSGVDDPYAAVKEEFNQRALALAPQLRQRIQAASNPLETAVRFAIAGNVIDFGVSDSHLAHDIENLLEEALHAPLDTTALQHLAPNLDQARHILFLADNTGEIVFDGLLLEQLPCDKVTLAVRGGSIINDATLDDARSLGLTDLVHTIDNGSDAPGTLLDDCHEEFRRAYDQADLIIAKGQGNYESLHDADKHIFFLFKAKCEVTANIANVKLGSWVFIDHHGDQ